MAVLSGFSDPRPPVVRPIYRRRAEKSASTTVATLVAERARAGGAGVAMLDERGEHVVTWDDIEKAAGRWRDRFGAGWSPGEVADIRVGLLMSSTNFSREYLAVLAAGVTVVPLDPASSEAELLWSSASLALTHVMSDEGDLIALHSVRSRVRPHTRVRSSETPLPASLAGDYPLELDALPGALRGSGAGRAWHPSIAPLDTPFPTLAQIDHPAVVVATKGSTGAPKLVAFTERQLLTAAANVVDHFGLQPGDRGYVATPLSGVDSQVVGILAMLLSGGSVVLADRFDRRSFWAQVERTQSTWLNIAPAMVNALAGVPGPDAVVRDRVRFARVGGATLSLVAHSKFWQSTGISLVETYTLTEASGQVTANPLDLAGQRPGSAGLAVGFDVRIVDDERRQVPCDTLGWIQVRGATVVTHYLSYGRNRSSLPAHEADGWFQTGDLGYQSREGYLYLVGHEPGSEAESESAGETMACC